MKLHNRILSTLLAVIMMLGSISLLTVGTSAAASSDDIDVESVYTGTVYNTPEEKLKNGNMKLMLERNGYQLYVDAISGEVATVEVATGQILFSNPYDVATSGGKSAKTKMQILSQLVVQYVENDTTSYLYSFEEAALRDQITVLNIKNGVRVEYTIGREESRKLVPRWISEESYQKYIDEPLKEAVERGEIDPWYYGKFDSYYEVQALSKKKSQKAKEQLLTKYPICEFLDIRVFSESASSVELNWCETYIKTYCEDYSFEQMDADHEETGYVATDEQYPVFKMALEYYLDENGLTVRLPCNGLRYDMAVYTLNYISVLPYMGAGHSNNPGYNFYPDGSGSLFDFEQLNTTVTTRVSGKIYGLDYAYHTINVGSAYQKSIRYPVYGTVASEKLYSFNYSEPELNKKGEETGNMLPKSMTVSSTVMTKDDITAFLTKKNAVLTSEITEDTYNRGYVAIIEAGDSLAEIETYHAGATSSYNTLMNFFNPKPKDSYDISDAISVTNSSTWTVVSDRKYTGSIQLRYRMLIDDEAAATAKEKNNSYTYYETSWLGMAEAYRDYLISNGTLTKLTDEEIEENIPLYLEVFGTLETLQTFMTIPVNEMTPLTTFENIWEMYTNLSGEGVKNINFKLTGFANGGLYSTIPSSLKWEKAVGGKDGLAELLRNAQTVNAQADQHIGIYPDFDFAYSQKNELFDSLYLKDDAIKTIDNRYSSKRQYSATQQSYVSFYQLAIAPSRYSKFYTKLLKNYEKYGLTGMSIASLGTSLNSDFDEDEPYNREDSKKHTIEAFEDLKAAGYSLMTEGANAYTWGYVDHIINVDLDSSRYVKSSASVPFIGAVLHGYVQFAGNPFNEEGDTNYAMLRAIENGAGLYFILSYQNTNELKEDSFYSQYYSVRYDIWEEDVIKYYNELNDVLKDVQNKVIIDHEFLVGERVLDLDELEEELANQLKEAAEAEKKQQEEVETSKVLEAADAWKLAEGACDEIEALVASMKAINEDEIAHNFELLKYYINALPGYVENVLKAYAKDKADAEAKKEEEEAAGEASSGAAKAAAEEDEEEEVTISSATQATIDTLQMQLSTLKSLAISILKGYAKLDREYAAICDIVESVENAKSVIESSNTLSAEVRKAMADEVQEYLDTAKGYLPQAEKELTWSTDEKQITKELAVNTAVAALTDHLVVAEEYAEFADEFNAVCKESLYTAQDIYDAGVLIDGSIGGGSVGDDDKVKDRYVVDNNQIVVVTYGDRDDATHEKTAYKSFILNYNNYSVKVVYNGVSYTIPSGEYVEIYA